MGPQSTLLDDGRRLHLHHGPIDLIIDAYGPDRNRALRAACDRFETILDELVPDLPELRSQANRSTIFRSVIADRMQDAACAFAPDFATPMIAVAGAVADTVLGAMTTSGLLSRAYVNNGGDIALHLEPPERFVAAIANARSDRVVVDAQSPVRGIASSGWRGRSQSLGIADTVTVLAATAAQADAAATLIANAIDLPGSDKISRTPASELNPDSDLGDRLVTTDVLPLTPDETSRALDRGASFADTCVARGLIVAAHLVLSGDTRTIGTPHLLPKDPIYA